MKNLNLFDRIEKIIKKKHKWNVSILIILVLLACSMMWILTMNYLNNLISYTDDTYGYYKSYYIAKAWLELALTEIDNTQIWFSQAISEDDPINLNNFSCIWCHFVSEVRWRSPFISNYFWQSTWCDENTALSLLSGESITLPLFYDNSANFAQVFDSVDHVKNIANYLNILRLIPVWSYPVWYELGLWVVFENSEYIFMKSMPLVQSENMFANYLDDFVDYYWNVLMDNWLLYLVISNPNDEEVKFCIWNKEWLDPYKTESRPTTKYFIMSRWEYKWKTIWLQAIYAQPIPSFFISPYSY